MPRTEDRITVPAMPSVLLAEDDPAIADPLARALEREGHEVTVFATGPGALEGALAGSASLLILDLGLPGLDGLDVCRALRAQHSTLPVLVLTARSDEVDFVVGLDAGADDYVGKPFRLAELLARVRALLRRGVTDVLLASGVRMEVAARKTWCDDEEVHLSNKEFELLRALLERAGDVVTRDHLMREIWANEDGQASKTLDMHISWLRRKLGDDAAGPRLITTLRGVGFRFEREQ